MRVPVWADNPKKILLPAIVFAAGLVVGIVAGNWSTAGTRKVLRAENAQLATRNNQLLTESIVWMEKWAADKKKLDVQRKQITVEAGKLLLSAAAEPNGVIELSGGGSGYSLSVGSTALTAGKIDQRTRAKWEEAIDFLVREGLVERDQFRPHFVGPGASDIPGFEHYKMTAKGYRFTDELRDSLDK